MKNLLKLSLLLIALTWCVPSHAAIVKVQSTNCVSVSSGPDVSCAYGSNVTSGNLLIACWMGESGETVTFSDTLTNTWNTGVTEDSGNGSDGMIICKWAIANGTGATTVLADQVTDYNHMHIAEYSGITASALDQTGTVYDIDNNGTVSVSTAGAIAQSEELVFVMFGNYRDVETYTAGTGYTLTEAQMDGGGWSTASEDNNTRTGLSGVQTATATYTGSNDFPIGIIMTFKAPVAATPIQRRRPVIF